MKTTRLGLLGLFLAGAAHAQAPSPAQMSITPTTPQVLQTLDSSKTWVPLGTVDAATHTWKGRGAAFAVDQFGAKGDFVNDDGPAIVASINAAAVNGGTVLLASHPYWNKTQAITVPRNVTVACASAFVKYNPNFDFTAMPCTIYQAVAAGKLVNNGALKDVGVFQDRLHFAPPPGNLANPLPAGTRAAARAFISGFTGIGVSLGPADNTESGSGSVIENVMIGGFATCIDGHGAPQIQIRQVLGDCTNGLHLENSHDDNFLSDVEFWEFTTTHKSWAAQKWTIADIQPVGGLFRVTLAVNANLTNDPPITGETFDVLPNVGGLTPTSSGLVVNSTAAGASGRWTVTAIDATHVDLQGSNPTPSTTGTTILGSSYVTVASTNNLAVGMNVLGAGIPAGTRIGAVWRTRTAISLDQSHPATASASGVALSFTSDAFVADSVSSMNYTAYYRDGTGFYIGNEEGTNCSHCFPFGYQIGFEFNDAVFSTFSNSEEDGITNIVPNQNYLPIGVKFTNSSYANTWQGGSITSSGVHVWSDGGFFNGVGNVVRANYPATSTNNSIFLEHKQGGLSFADMMVSVQGAILLDSSGFSAALNGVNAINALLYSTDASGPHFTGSNNVFGGLLAWQNPTAVRAQALSAMNPGGAAVVNFYDGSQPIDGRYSRLSTGGPGMCLQTLNDAYVSATNYWCVKRNLNVATSMIMNVPLGYAGYVIGGSPALPTCDVTLRGTSGFVSNGQASPPYLGAVSTTGTVVAPVFCNGTAWVYH